MSSVLGLLLTLLVASVASAHVLVGLSADGCPAGPRPTHSIRMR